MMSADKVRFKSRVREWSAKLSTEITSIHVRPMSRKWASCSRGGILSFSDEVPELESDLQDYIIVHELLHLSVPNHGKLWKSLMRAHLGEYQELEAKLKERG